MLDNVIGSWKSFTFQMILPPDYPVVMQHLNDYFFCDEPLRKLLRLQCGLTQEEVSDYFGKSTPAKLSDNLSFMAIDSESGAVAGVQLQHIWTIEMARDSNCFPTSNLRPSMKAYHGAIRKLMGKSRALYPKIHETFGVSVAAFSFVSSTAAGFRHQGLATEMYRRMNILLKEEGYLLCVSVFTSPWSRKAAERNGFYELDPESRSYWADVRGDDSQLILPDADPADYSTVLIRNL